MQKELMDGRPVAAEVIQGFQRAREWNAIAHDPHTSPKTRKFAFSKKTMWVSRVVRAVPEVVDLGDTAMLPRGIVAVALPGIGALHVKLADVYPDVAKIMVEKMMAALNVRLVVTAPPRLPRDSRHPTTAAA